MYSLQANWSICCLNIFPCNTFEIFCNWSVFFLGDNRTWLLWKKLVEKSHLHAKLLAWRTMPWSNMVFRLIYNISPIIFTNSMILIFFSKWLAVFHHQSSNHLVSMEISNSRSCIVRTFNTYRQKIIYFLDF